MVSSINSNQAASRAQSAIRTNSDNITSSVTRLSSGNRIVKASDDVAGLSIGTALRTSVATLQVAKLNTSLGSSLLQVADGALAQVTEILQRQKAIATQAGSGSLGATERSYLNQEFQALTSEINRLVGQTNFNGVELLNGALSSSSALANTLKQSAKGAATISFASNPTTGQLATFLFGNTDQSTPAANNISIEFTTSTTPTALQVQIGATRADTVANLAAKLTSLAADPSYSDRLGQAIYTAQGETLTITSRTGGSLGNIFRIDTSSTALVNQGIGGEFGGTKLNMFGVGFSSATSDIVAATPSTTAPFKDNAVIYASIGDRTPIALATLGTTDSLQTIVNKINANTASTGVKANLTYDPTASTNQYNINLQYNNSSERIAIYSDGFYNATSGSSIPTLNSGTTSFSLFRINDADGTIAAATSTAALPIDSDRDLLARFNNGSVLTLATATQITTTTTVGELAGFINGSADAITNGIRAIMLDTNGAITTVAADARNIRIEYSDANANVAVGTGRKLAVYQQDAFQSPNNLTTNTQALNTGAAVNTFNLLTANVTADLNSDVVSAGIGSGTEPFAIGNITVRVDGTDVTFAAIAASGLQDIANGLNAAANTAGLYGFKAEVTGADTGSTARNIRISYLNVANPAAAAPVVSITNPGAINLNSGGTVTYGSASIQGVARATTTVTANTTFGLAGGKDDGIGISSVSTTGTIGDALLTSLANSKARVVVGFPDIASADLTSNTNFRTDGTVYLTVGGQKFSFVTTAVTADQIAIGATLKETLDNAVSTINRFLTDGNATGATEYELSQMSIKREGNTLVFEGKTLSNVTELNGYTPSNINITGFSGGATRTNNGNLNNASNRTNNTFGVDMTGVSNKDFIGKIGGFSGAYKSSNTADFSVKVGEYTYTALSVSTNPTSNTTLRFFSNTLANGTNGGYFDIQLAANQGANVSSQAGVDTLAARLNASFSSLSFNQQRNIESYNGTQTLVADNVVFGSLLGSKVSAQLPDFSTAKISDVTVTAPAGSIPDAKISLTINGVKYSSAVGLGNQLGANQTFRLTSETDVNNFVDFTTGNSAISISSASRATALETAFKDAFGATEGSAALSFQVGTSSTDALTVSIDDVSTDSIYKGKALSVDTQANALVAGTAIDEAIKIVTAVRADVGALQSRFNFASANIDSTVQNQDAARGELLDTDIASESTSFSVAQVKLQAGISTLAQANQQLQSLLKLIG